MSLAVLFALVSLACAGCTDVVFGRYAQADRSRGLFVLCMGATWTIIQAVILAADGRAIRFDAQTVVFGLIAGLLISVSNTLLIESLTRIDVGIGSTIYRLNTIAVVVMATFMLDEPLTAAKLLGVILGSAAVVLLFERKREYADERTTLRVFFSLVVFAALLRACFGILAKVAATRGLDLRVLLLVNAPVWIVMGFIYTLWRGETMRISGAMLRYAAVSGALICGVANFLMLAVERGQASVVVPIANMSFLVALLISVGLGMERLTPRKVTAVGLALAAIVALTRA